jgi:hypothetical protein
MNERPESWLREHGAQHDLVGWARAFDDFDALWRACPRGDWILAIAVVRGLPAGEIERALLSVATLALDHVDDDERNDLAALLAAPRALRILASGPLAERASSADSPALSAALGAIAIALSGSIEDAASVPALVSQAAVFDAGDCAMMAALSYAQKRSAELVREVIPSIA